MESKTTYFAQEGKENTANVLRLVMERAGQLGIKKVLVPSTRVGSLGGSGSFERPQDHRCHP
jgi:hypothetical protein